MCYRIHTGMAIRLKKTIPDKVCTVRLHHLVGGVCTVVQLNEQFLGCEDQGLIVSHRAVTATGCVQHYVPQKLYACMAREGLASRIACCVDPLRYLWAQGRCDMQHAHRRMTRAARTWQTKLPGRYVSHPASQAQDQSCCLSSSDGPTAQAK